MAQDDNLIERRKTLARNKRFKKAICKDINLDGIRNFLYDAESDADEIGYATQNDDAFVDALGGDEEEAFEFVSAYSALCNDMEQFQNDLDQCWVPECFDDLFAACAPGRDGLMGYDEYECDYYGLDTYTQDLAQQEAEKRLLRLTKTDLIAAMQQCVKIAVSYLGIRSRYEDLSASIAIIRAQNDGLLGALKRIDELYDMSQRDDYSYDYKKQREFDKLANGLPAECWLR